MALIEFENKPSTDTPINADNLNNNFEFLKGLSIADAGANNYGAYLKFENGIMLTFQEQTLTNVDINNAWGSIYSSTNIIPPNFPVEYKEIPHVFINKKASDASNFWVMYNADGASTEVAGRYQLLRASSITLDTTISIFAIGYWK